MLCIIFLAEAMSVRKTVTALVAKTLQKCNAHWRTRVYEQKQQSVGILVTGRARPVSALPSNITVEPLSSRLWPPRT